MRSIDLSADTGLRQVRLPAMRALLWVAVKLSRLFLAVGGLCFVGMAAAAVSYVFGGREFPTPFEAAEGSIGTYMWQVGAMAVGSWLLWRICLAFVLRTGGDHDVYRATGREYEQEREREREQEQAMAAYKAAPVAAQCTACGHDFKSWDEAMDHADDEHGRDRTPEESYALLRRL